MDAGAVAAALEDARFDARQASRHEDLADDVRGRAELTEWERLAQLLAAAPSGAVDDPDANDVIRAELVADAAAAAVCEAELREAARGAAGLLTPPVLAHSALLTELARLVPGAVVDHLAFAARLATSEPEAAGTLGTFLTRARPVAKLAARPVPPRHELLALRSGDVSGVCDRAGVHTASALLPSMLWLAPIALLASATTGWVLAKWRYRRRPTVPPQCQRSCCSPARVDGLDHREFEYLIRDLMIRDGADKVRRVGGAGDNGADVVAVDPAGKRWIIQCKHRKQGLSGAPVGVREFQILNGTGRPVHRGDVIVMVTNGAITGRARNFARDQNLHVVDRFLLEDWIERDRPVWELLGMQLRPCTEGAVPAPRHAAHNASATAPSSGSGEQQEPLYTLAEANEAGFVPWKPTTMRQYLGRSQRRGIPLPRSAWDGQAHHYTEEQLRTWLENWRAKAGPSSKAHELPSE